MKRLLPPLNSLRAFEAAARLGSFNKAADELHVTHGAVSRHIQILEDWLGTPMFRRLNRRVLLTDAGRAYQAEIAAAFDRIAIATLPHLKGERIRLLRVSATPSLTLRWLIPRLSSFQLDNPTIEVRVTTSNEPLSTADPAFDVLLRRGPEQVAGFTANWSLSDYRVPVCSPSRMRDNLPKEIADLEHHTLLYSTTRPTVWSEWMRTVGVGEIKSRHSLVFEHSFQAVQAAVDGVGIAMGSWSFVMDDVAAGRLVLPFPEPKIPTDLYRAYVPNSKEVDFVTARFCSWLERVSAPLE